MIKCAFDVEEGKCSVLLEKSCKGCRFFKSKEKLAEGREKAMKHIRSLPEEQRMGILVKYYSSPRKGGMRGGRD